MFKTGLGVDSQEHFVGFWISQGNKRFRDIVALHRADYIRAPKVQKPSVARVIVRAIRNGDPPGRFLKKDEKTGLWYDVGDKKAAEKTSQALREKAPGEKEQPAGASPGYLLSTPYGDQTPAVAAAVAAVASSNGSPPVPPLPAAAAAPAPVGEVPPPAAAAVPDPASAAVPAPVSGVAVASQPTEAAAPTTTEATSVKVEATSVPNPVEGTTTAVPNPTAEAKAAEAAEAPSQGETVNI